MALDSKHPLFEERDGDFLMLRHSHAGEGKVKAQGVTYLPATSSHELDGMTNTTDLGYINYQAYKTRAVFPDYVKDAVEMAVGMMHRKPPTIELPKQLEFLEEKATLEGESLQDLLRRINEEQLITGRLGLLAELPNGEIGNNAKPYLVLYPGECIINWDNSSLSDKDETVNLVVIDESGPEIEESFNWKQVEKFRVLQLGDIDPEKDRGINTQKGQKRIYRTGVFKGSKLFSDETMMVPVYKGGSLEAMPFTFINTKDLNPEPDDPPLLGLARLCMTIYRGEADYRFNLFMQGQDTFVVIGNEIQGDMPSSDATTNSAEGATRTGAGARVNVDIGGDAKFVGVSPNGLSEQRQALENDRMAAQTKTVQLASSALRQAEESGKSRKMRLASESANLTQIAITGANGLQIVLRRLAVWMGADPNKVRITPNLDFTDFEFDGNNLVQIVTAKQLGAPISNESIHSYMSEKGLTKMSFEDELLVIDQETALSEDEIGGPGLEDDATDG